MPVALNSLPRPALFGLYGGAVGVLVALVFGELTWWALSPPPAPKPDAHTAAATDPPPAQETVPPILMGQIAVTVSPKVSVYPGEKNTVSVRVVRELFNGPILVRFTTPPGLSASELTVPVDAESGTVEISALADTKPGTYRVSVLARGEGNGGSATATLEVTVVPPPPPLPRLSVTTSPQLQVSQRGKNTFAVRIKRGEFDEAVTVVVDKVPNGVTVPPITIPAGATEAQGELTADGAAAAGVQKITVTARAKPKEGDISAETSAELAVLAVAKVPVDVVFVLDCTGSMKKTVAGVSENVQKFADDLVRANCDVRFGLVGFQDTTLSQSLKIPRLGEERMSPSAAALRTAMQNLRLGGGGGEGESSMDGIAEAADYPLRTGAVRVLVLITDGGPKRIDGRMKSTEETVKYMRAKKIDQLQVVALPDHRKQFEPFWEGARGKYFDLKARGEADAFDKLMGDVAKAITEVIPEPPPAKVEPGASAQDPVLPQFGSVKPSPLPPGQQPEAPRCQPAGEKPVSPPSAMPMGDPKPGLTDPVLEEPKGKRALALAAWALVVVSFVCGGLVAGQLTFLPGEVPSVKAAAAGYGGGVVAGLLAGTAGYVVFTQLGIAFLGRLAGATAFGLCTGAIVPLAERLFRGGVEELEPLPEELPPEELPEEAPLPIPAPRSAPNEKPLELDDAPAPAAPMVPQHKPNIASTKPRDGCPGCGRMIPGAVGERYCMVCDQTF
jgi:hypothetical protein